MARSHPAPFAVLILALVVMVGGCSTGGAEPPLSEQGRAPTGELLPVIETYRLDNAMVVRDLRIGQGDAVALGDTVRVHTLGTFPESGNVFYSTVGSDPGSSPEPLTAPIRGLIRGWQIGLPGNEVLPAMREGGVRTLSIPWELAYGEQGRPDPEDPSGGIPPRADLFFTVELIEIIPSDAQGSQGQ